MIKVLGNEIKLHEPDPTKDYFVKAFYYNKDCSEKLTLVYHFGDVGYSFDEFRVIKENRTDSSIECMNSIQHFVTGKNIRLGMTKGQLVDSLGYSFVQRSEKDIEVIKYEIDDFEGSDFLKHYGLPLYYGKYRFENNRLISFEFGFEYP